MAPNHRRFPGYLWHTLFPYENLIYGEIKKIQGIRSDRPEEPWTEVHNTVQDVATKIIPKEKKCKKANWLSEEALQMAEKSKVKGKEERERYTQLKADFQRITRRDKKAFLSDQFKEIEEINRMGKNRDLFKKIRDTKGNFQRWAQ